ncbi:MAG: CBASS cGAMP synthase [Marinomonas sp.]|uniref:CBASS cGAMP synthase n=1 Tax=Marinomonas sp. TaxID=1904862 RepID=UPI003F9CAC27
MLWDLHGYYSNRSEGLISKLKLSEPKKEELKELRKTVRHRITSVFKEIQDLAKNNTASYDSMSFSILKENISHTSIKYLTSNEQNTILTLLNNMDRNVTTDFLKLKPRFWTQGSFQYDTLNLPYNSPPQEIDIDDGVYLPMALFENKPVIAHELLLLLVDSSLKSLVAEHSGWEFEAKRTCARIKIPEANMHIDVPMYAIPEEQFIEKEEAVLKAFNRQVYDSSDLMLESYSNYAVDPECVNLALRDDKNKWTNSDPKIVEDWFNQSSKRIGSHLKKLCRFMKSWRDAQWQNGGGPSSISLMAATVKILDTHAHDETNFGETMKLIANKLPETFNAGVESPDDTDEKPLFPPFSEQDLTQKEIVNRMSELESILIESEIAPTKSASLHKINEAFGHRVSNRELIVTKPAAPAFKDEPSVSAKPQAISSTFTSG